MADAPPFGRRDGEIAVGLPAHVDAGVYFIGRCRTPWRRREDCPKNAGLSDAEGALEIDAPWAEGLAGLAAPAQIWALYWMDRAPRDLVVQRPRHATDSRGVFALRSPARPNPVALSRLDLKRIEPLGAGARLVVVGLDCLDGTPLIDVKPVTPGDVREPGVSP